jgi:hypothetical protein
MLNDFFRINLPYGIAKNKDKQWIAFNREYLPLGFNNQSLKGNPENSYLTLPVYTKYKNITEKMLLEIAEDESKIERNEKNEIVKIFLYNDKTNPVNHTRDKKELWEKYFNKLKRLSKLSI